VEYRRVVVVFMPNIPVAVALVMALTLVVAMIVAKSFG
jgi:hypothetical protein